LYAHAAIAALRRTQSFAPPPIGAIEILSLPINHLPAVPPVGAMLVQPSTAVTSPGTNS